MKDKSQQESKEQIH